MPAGGGKAAEHRGLRRLLVEMEGLRVELGGERDDLLAGHKPRPVLGDAALLEVFPVSAG